MSDYPQNLPILYRNIMYGLPNHFATEVFLWAVERPGEDAACYRAEKLAREADRLVANLRPMIKAGFSIHKAAGLNVPDSALDDLMGFHLTRHANWRYGGNIKPTYIKSQSWGGL